MEIGLLAITIDIGYFSFNYYCYHVRNIIVTTIIIIVVVIILVIVIFRLLCVYKLLIINIIMFVIYTLFTVKCHQTNYLLTLSRAYHYLTMMI